MSTKPDLSECASALILMIKSAERLIDEHEATGPQTPISAETVADLRTAVNWWRRASGVKR